MKNTRTITKLFILLIAVAFTTLFSSILTTTTVVTSYHILVSSLHYHPYQQRLYRNQQYQHPRNNDKNNNKSIMSSSSSVLKQRHFSTSSKQALPPSSQRPTSTSTTTTTTTTALSSSSSVSSFFASSSPLSSSNLAKTTITSNNIIVIVNIMLIFICTNIFGCIISLLQKKQSHYHVDLLGTGAFCIVGFYTLFHSSNNNNNNIRIIYSSMAMILWSIRLVSFLFYRIIQQNGHDARLTEVFTIPSSTIGFWCISTIWGILCSIPHWIGILSPPNNMMIGSQMVTLYIGIIIFLVGFMIETTSDLQKWYFKQSLSSSSSSLSSLNQFCNIGLWSTSQHPNWFGNLVLWIGIYIMNLSSYIILQIPSTATAIKGSSIGSILQQITSFLYRYHRCILAAIGPLFMYLLFYSQATGIILNDTLQANYNKYGYNTNMEYTKYIDTTPLIIPNIVQIVSQWIMPSPMTKE